MTRFLAACSMLAVSFGIVAADEMNGTIKKVDGNKIIFVKEVPKGSPKGTKGEQVALTTADSVKVAQGTFNKKAKTYTTGDSLTDGLKNVAFSAKKGAKVHITTNADNKVTKVLVLAKAKKKKAQ